MIMVKDMVHKLIFFLLFIVLLVIVASAYHWVQQMIQPNTHYQKPIGDAVKVFDSSPHYIDKSSMPDRLVWFLWYGE
ncbi:MAG TPA: YqzK family protein [Candidatus Paenibacillus intestinavium]|nr:YqzK family protein [Candidatus Paenibacillus intestinavium]